MFHQILSRALFLLIGLVIGIIIQARIFQPRRSVPALDAALIAGPSVLDGKSDLSGVPRLRLTESEFDFGTVEAGTVENAEQISHTFVVQNAGTKALVISAVKPSCGCTTARIDKQTIPPGEAGKLAVNVNLKGRSGRQAQKILIQSNDPGRASAFVSLNGIVRERIIKEPPILELGRISSGQTAHGEVDIRAIDGATFQLTGVATVPKALSVKTTQLSPGERFRIAVSLSPPFKDGEFRGLVTLQTDNPLYRDIPVPIRAYVGPGGPLLVGDTPAIDGVTLDGASLNISSLRGSPVIVVFWASWCGFCRHEVPNLVTMYQKYHQKGLHIVGVNEDDDKDRALAACRDWKIPWPNLMNNQHGSSKSENTIAKQYQVGGIPAIYILDSAGKVIRGNTHQVDFADTIEQLMASPSKSLEQPAGIVKAETHL